MGRGGATSSRGRGKFKVSRGGGRHFSRDLDPRDILKGNVRSGQGDDSDEDEDESSEEESEEDIDAGDEPKLSKEMAALNLKLGNTEVVAAPEEEEMSRAERKALKKAQADAKAKKAAAKTGGKQVKFGSDSESESEDDEPIQQTSKPKAVELSRKEREAADKKAAQERYAKLHAQGKTTEAKTDLARLQEVRRRREAAAAQREAEAEEAAKEAEAKKAKAAGRKL